MSSSQSALPGSLNWKHEIRFFHAYPHPLDEEAVEVSLIALNRPRIRYINNPSARRGNFPMLDREQFGDGRMA